MQYYIVLSHIEMLCVKLNIRILFSTVVITNVMKIGKDNEYFMFVGSKMN